MTAFLGGLLGLLGRDADPVSSREFILLARCVEEIWAKGETATLESLVGAAAQPPFGAIGALPLETFFPKKERDGLVLGPERPPRLARDVRLPRRRRRSTSTPSCGGGRGPAKLSIFSIAHLSDPERLFVVATLLSRVRSWLRSQPGSTSLARADLHRRDLRLLPAVGRAADEEAAPLAPQAGPRLRRRHRPRHAEPGRPRLQGARELRLLVGRDAPDRARPAPPRRRPHRRRRR